MELKTGLRLSQKNLECMTEEERNSLVGKTALDDSEMEFGEVKIKEVKRNTNGYQITFETKRGKFTYLGYTQFLELN